MRQLKIILILVISACTLAFAQAEVFSSVMDCHSFHLKHTQDIPDNTNDFSSIGIEHGELVVLEMENSTLVLPEVTCKRTILYYDNYRIQIITSFWRPPQLFSIHS
ncbi:MAG: hypothetical protein Q8861_04275 [Bacteroidota bacterium]|nr:hypothetical protein [Bacteroidota bacterium]